MKKTHIRRSSGVLDLPYIFRTHKRVYKPTVVMTMKLLKMGGFCHLVGSAYRDGKQRLT